MGLLGIPFFLLMQIASIVDMLAPFCDAAETRS